jgi:hypothetical protein
LPFMSSTPAEQKVVTWAEVCARRLARHGLAQPIGLERLAEQVGMMCGAHAQVMSAAELSIGLRVAGSTSADVRAALWTERTLVKSIGPRGTVHLLAAEDLPMWTGAMAAIPPMRTNPNDRLLTPEQQEEVIAAIDVALANAELTVDELTKAIVAIAGSWAGDPVMDAFQEKWPRWREATYAAANRGVLCFGPNRGRNVTYTHPRRWLPGFKPADGQTALAQLVKRYLYAYGPATPQQFAQWLNAPRRWAAELFDALGAEVERVLLDGAEGWVVAGDTVMPAEPPNGLRLLPYFDAYVVGCHPRHLLFPGAAAERTLTRGGGQAGNFQVLLMDGVVAGVWHQRRSGRKVDITVEPLQELTAARQRLLDEQVAWLGAFLDSTPRLTIGRVTVGPHA